METKISNEYPVCSKYRSGCGAVGRIEEKVSVIFEGTVYTGYACPLGYYPRVCGWCPVKEEEVETK